MKIAIRIRTRSALLCAALLSPVVSHAAQDAVASGPAAGEPAVIPTAQASPEAQAVLDRMTRYLRGLQRFAIESQSTRDEVVARGYKLQHNEHARLVVQRPDKLRAEVSGDIRNRSFVYDGKKLAMYSPDDAVYVRIDAPDSIGKLIPGLLDAGVEMPLIDVLFQAEAGTLTQGVRGGVLIGTASIDGVACDHLAFRQASVDWQIWVERGDRPLPRRLVITTRYAVGDPQFEATLRWDLDPNLDASSFTFSAPKGAREVPFREAAIIRDAGVANAGERP